MSHALCLRRQKTCPMIILKPKSVIRPFGFKRKVMPVLQADLVVSFA